MVEMYLVGVSTRRIEDVSEILWGSSVSAATVSNLNDKAIASVEEWRNRPLDRAHPCAYVDGVYLKRSWGGAYENVAVMVPSASTTTATARPSGPRRASRSRQSAGGSSRPGCGPASCAACVGGRRQSGGDGRIDRGGLPRRLPALCRALPPQRARRGAEVQARGCCCHAQGDPLHGVARGGRGQSARGRGRARGDATRGGLQGREGRIRGDPGVYGLPARALASHPHQQRHRAAEPRDPQADSRGRHLPGREVGANVRRREAQVRRGGRVGIVCFVNLSFHKTASVRFTRQREDSSRTSVALAPILSSPTTPRA